MDVELCDCVRCWPRQLSRLDLQSLSMEPFLSAFSRLGYALCHRSTAGSVPRVRVNSMIGAHRAVWLEGKSVP